jgi:ATP-dependent RNA helicase DDX41
MAVLSEAYEGRAGVATVGVLQEVETVNVLDYLQNTRPPVVIFQQTRADVDDLHIYFSLRNVEAVAYHAGKCRLQRKYAIEMIKTGKKHVLVATKAELHNLEYLLNLSLSDPVLVRLVRP